MQRMMNFLSRIGDKAGVLGTLVSAMGCAACFPAIASLGAAAGLGFLSHWEGLFINTLLPLFAAVALAANFLGWFSHRQYLRTILGMIGPAMVLATLFPLWEYEWSTDLLYAGSHDDSYLDMGSVFARQSPLRRRCLRSAAKVKR
jgi:mercuric ion transport protein